MRKIVFLIVFPVLILSAFTEKIFGQEFYKWVDEKGTVHFSDNPVYARAEQQKEKHSKENGIEVLKKSDPSKRPMRDSEGRIIINYTQGSGGGSVSSGSGGGSRTVSSGTS
ncbi:MAG: DUF4124 domain-containing protein [Thermodesulfobacteriota bacterium]